MWLETHGDNGDDKDNDNFINDSSNNSDNSSISKGNDMKSINKDNNSYKVYNSIIELIMINIFMILISYNRNIKI